MINDPAEEDPLAERFKEAPDARFTFPASDWREIIPASPVVTPAGVVFVTPKTSIEATPPPPTIKSPAVARRAILPEGAERAVSTVSMAPVKLNDAPAPGTIEAAVA